MEKTLFSFLHQNKIDPDLLTDFLENSIRACKNLNALTAFEYVTSENMKRERQHIDANRFKRAIEDTLFRAVGNPRLTHYLISREVDIKEFYNFIYDSIQEFRLWQLITTETTKNFNNYQLIVNANRFITLLKYEMNMHQPPSNKRHN